LRMPDHRPRRAGRRAHLLLCTLRRTPGRGSSRRPGVTSRRHPAGGADESIDVREETQMMELSQARVAFLATNGYEDSEFTSPWQALAAAGAQLTMVAPEPGEVTGKDGHVQAVD